MSWMAEGACTNVIRTAVTCMPVTTTSASMPPPARTTGKRVACPSASSSETTSAGRTARRFDAMVTTVQRPPHDRAHFAEIGYASGHNAPPPTRLTPATADPAGSCRVRAGAGRRRRGCQPPWTSRRDLTGGAMAGPIHGRGRSVGCPPVLRPMVVRPVGAGRCPAARGAGSRPSSRGRVVLGDDRQLVPRGERPPLGSRRRVGLSGGVGGSSAGHTRWLSCLARKWGAVGGGAAVVLVATGAGRPAIGAWPETTGPGTAVAPGIARQDPDMVRSAGSLWGAVGSACRDSRERTRVCEGCRWTPALGSTHVCLMSQA